MSTPISGLASGSPAQNTDEFIIARSGANYKLTLTQITSAEATARAAADVINANAIAAEAITRAADDLTLTNAISAETAARIAADALKLNSSYLDTDGTLAANSDVKIPSQKAIKTYVDGKTGTATEGTAGILEVATNAETSAGVADDKIITPLKLNTILPVSVGSGTRSVLTTGASNTVSGNYSTALGSSINVSGDYSVGFSGAALVSGDYALAGGGLELQATGLGSFIWHYNIGGYGPIPTSYAGAFSVLLGGANSTTSNSYDALIACQQTTVSADYVVALGIVTETLSQQYTTYTRTLNIKDGIQKRGIVNTSAANYAVTYQNNIISCDTSGASVSVDLPASPATGQEIEVIRTSASNVCTINGNGKNINGAATKVLTAAAYAKARIIYNGTQWLVMDEI